MTEPDCPQKAPYPVDLEAGKSYAWCVCGKSANQPFCDGAHAGSDFKPIVWKAEESKQVFLCGCKRTGGPPFCDGAHARL